MYCCTCENKLLIFFVFVFHFKVYFNFNKNWFLIEIHVIHRIIKDGKDGNEHAQKVTYFLLF